MCPYTLLFWDAGFFRTLRITPSRRFNKAYSNWTNTCRKVTLAADTTDSQLHVLCARSFQKTSLNQPSWCKISAGWMSWEVEMRSWWDENDSPKIGKIDSCSLNPMKQGFVCFPCLSLKNTLTIRSRRYFSSLSLLVFHSSLDFPYVFIPPSFPFPSLASSWQV